MRAVKEHLAKLNGKVAAHEKEIGETKIHLAERNNQCPLVEKVEDRLRRAEDRLRRADYITLKTATRKTSSAWMRKIWPFIWAAAGIFGLLVLQNASFILKAFAH